VPFGIDYDLPTLSGIVAPIVTLAMPANCPRNIKGAMGLGLLGVGRLTRHNYLEDADYIVYTVQIN